MTKLTKPSSSGFIAALDNYINAKIADNEQLSKGSPQEVARSLKRVQSATESLYKTLEEYLDLVVEYKLTEAIKSGDALKKSVLEIVQYGATSMKSREIILPLKLDTERMRLLGERFELCEKQIQEIESHRESDYILSFLLQITSVIFGFTLSMLTFDAATDNPSFQWEKGTDRYRNKTTGRFISKEAVYTLTQKRIENVKQDLGQVAQLLLDGKNHFESMRKRLSILAKKEDLLSLAPSNMWESGTRDLVETLYKKYQNKPTESTRSQLAYCFYGYSKRLARRLGVEDFEDAIADSFLLVYDLLKLQLDIGKIYKRLYFFLKFYNWKYRRHEHSREIPNIEFHLYRLNLFYKHGLDAEVLEVEEKSEHLQQTLNKLPDKYRDILSAIVFDNCPIESTQNSTICQWTLLKITEDRISKIQSRLFGEERWLVLIEQLIP